MKYDTYLIRKHYSLSTRKEYKRCLRQFIAWCSEQSLLLEQVNYTTLMHYVEYLQKEGLQTASINQIIHSLNAYFKYEIFIEQRADNPAERIVIHGKKQKVLPHVLSEDELEDLYYSYPTRSKRADHEAAFKRNKVIVGLMVYQGLSTTDLSHLELTNVDAYKAKIEAKGHRKSKSRILKLSSAQILQLQEYVETIRPILDKNHNEKFIVGNKRIKDVIVPIIKQLKNYNAKLENAQHIRTSRIVLWLQRYNLRKTQYLAGHKYISSTEKYRRSDMETLQKAVQQYHPLR